MFEQYNDIMTVEDVCEALKIGRNICYKLLGNNEIKAFRIGSRTWKIPRESLEEYVVKSSRASSNK